MIHHMVHHMMPKMPHLDYTTHCTVGIAILAVPRILPRILPRHIAGHVQCLPLPLLVDELTAARAGVQH